MDCAKIVLMLIFVSAILAGADVVGTLNVHTALSGQAKTGVDTGQPIPVQVDFSKTQDGTYDISVWSGNRQIEAANTRLDVTQASVATANANVAKTNSGLERTLTELGEMKKSLARTNATLGTFDHLIQKVSLLRR